MKLKYQLAIVAVTILFLAGILLVRQQRAPGLIKDFFSAETQPINLAMFRVVFFVALACSFSVPNIVWFSSIPAELRFPPPGLHWLLAHLPINETWAWSASVLLLFFCFTAAVGLFTCTSAVVCLVLGLYVLGIPQCYGKINHYHHLLWFTAILAVSPCADVLSIDAIRWSRKRADNGSTEPPGSSNVYALPLRFVWLLMGAIYFSAGFWKVWTGGYKWAFSDNPRNMFYNKWMEFGVWRPFFRIDQHPFLYQMSAAASIAFELSFIVIIFFPAIRYLAALGGLAFHNMTGLFMRIYFWQMQVCYVSFVDWQRVFRFAGRRLFSEEMYLIYDGNCRLCRRTIAALRTLDVFGRVHYLSAFDEPAIRSHGLDWLNSDDLLLNMHAVKGRKVWRGFAAYRTLAQRLPVLWPLVPFLYLWPLTLIGRRVYRHVADTRACDISVARSLDAARIKTQRSGRAIVLVSLLILYGALVTAVGKVNSWPFAGYPTFEDLDKPEVSVITMSADTPTGTIEINPFAEQVGQQMPPARLMAMLGRISSVADEAERRLRLQALWKLWSRDSPDLQRVTAVRFYRDTLSSLPERQNDNLLQREFLYELRLTK